MTCLPGSTSCSADGPGWTCDDRRVASSRPARVPTASPLGQSAPQITVVVDIPASQTGAVTNTAAVSTVRIPTRCRATTTTRSRPRRPSGRPRDREVVHQATFVPGDSGRLPVHRATTSDRRSPTPVVQITDTLPASSPMHRSPPSPAPGTARPPARSSPARCRDALPTGDDAVVDITVDIDPDHTGNIVNEARCRRRRRTRTRPTTPTTTTPTRIVEVDLAINKSHTGPVVAGENVTYTLARPQHRAVGVGGPGRGLRRPAGRPDVRVGDRYGLDVRCRRTDRHVHPARPGSGADADAPDITLVATVDPTAGPATLINRCQRQRAGHRPDPSNNTDHRPDPDHRPGQHQPDQDHDGRRPGRRR